MSHPARGPILSMGIDGKASAASRRRAISCLTSTVEEAAK
jgi:hypothetical protein